MPGHRQSSRKVSPNEACTARDENLHAGNFLRGALRKT
jgi:hypothetical protein